MTPVQFLKGSPNFFFLNLWFSKIKRYSGTSTKVINFFFFAHSEVHQRVLFIRGQMGRKVAYGNEPCEKGREGHERKWCRYPTSRKSISLCASQHFPRLFFTRHSKSNAANVSSMRKEDGMIHDRFSMGDSEGVVLHSLCCCRKLFSNRGCRISWRHHYVVNLKHPCFAGFCRLAEFFFSYRIKLKQSKM